MDELTKKMQDALRDAPKFFLGDDTCWCEYEMGYQTVECLRCKWNDTYDELLTAELCTTETN